MKSPSKTICVAALLILPILFLVGCTGATSVDILDKLIAGKVAGDVLDKAEGKANNLLLSAENTGNNLVSHSSNEMQVLIAQARRALGEEAKKVTSSLSNDRKALVQAVFEMSQKLEKGQEGIINIQDDVSINLDEIINRVPLLKDRLTIQRIKGIQHLKSSVPNYYLEFTGSGIGIPQNNRQAKITKFSVCLLYTSPSPRD